MCMPPYAAFPYLSTKDQTPDVPHSLPYAVQHWQVYLVRSLFQDDTQPKLYTKHTDNNTYDAGVSCVDISHYL